jgi:hypothetical protein
MMSLGHVHALFSHLEDYLRHGDLLPGPDRHRWSTDLPAYEFPTGDAAARVLARKHRTRDEWLLTAWAAGGANREVSVTIPKLGELTLLARDTASVYLAVPGPNGPAATLLDPDGLNPSAAVHLINATYPPPHPRPSPWHHCHDNGPARQQKVNTR